MTLVLIGPVCEDLIIIGDKESSKVGGATYFQSFVFEEFYNDYIAIVNASKNDLLDEFPDKSKLKLILKEDTHYFVNEYPDSNNLDIRYQKTNFANISISRGDLEPILSDINIDAFVLNPLNIHDFSSETIDYLNSFDVPIYISLQGFLRISEENGSLKLGVSEILNSLACSDSIFLDEIEFKIIEDYLDLFKSQFLIITNGSKGSRIKNDLKDINCKINPVKCDKILDATGCGDTYMAAFISAILNGKSLKEAGNFASLIASDKLKLFGPYKK
ncbi:PfkB family carbohydrate kinase [uncultured Methanobrevibacter sp.]|uniref:PfkB family carbohydrate kinase n=1 Tax=uncultured Methanobrevibacter sp. TaxID=253161 RepID=UPI0026087689